MRLWRRGNYREIEKAEDMWHIGKIAGTKKETPVYGDGGKLVWQKRSGTMRVQQRKRLQRKGAVILGGKKSTVYYSEERQRRIRWISLSLTRRSGQQRSVPTSVSDAGSRKRRRCIEQRVIHSMLEADRGSSGVWNPQRRGKKGGSYHKQKVIKRITRS